MEFLVEAKTADWVRSKDRANLLAVAQRLRVSYGKDKVSWSETAKNTKDQDTFSILLKVNAKSRPQALKDVDTIVSAELAKQYGNAFPPRMRYITTSG